MIFIFCLTKHLKRVAFGFDWNLCNTSALTNISLHFFSTKLSNFLSNMLDFLFVGLPLISCLQKLYQFISFHSVFIFDLFAGKTNIYLPRNLYQKYFETLSVNFLFRCLPEVCQHSFYFMIFYSRVSVMRGQVITPQGLGIVGIRVSVDKDSRFGFTLTRTGGW